MTYLKHKTNKEIRIIFVQFLKRSNSKDGMFWYNRNIHAFQILYTKTLISKYKWWYQFLICHTLFHLKLVGLRSLRQSTGSSVTKVFHSEWRRSEMETNHTEFNFKRTKFNNCISSSNWHSFSMGSNKDKNKTDYRWKI